MTQLLNLLIDGCILFDERIGGGNISFRLIIVVVRNEVDHGIVRKELLELGCELSRERLVRSQDERRTLDGFDRLCDRIGLSGPRYTEQGLVTHARFDILRKLLDRFWLIASWLEFGNHFEGLI